MKLPAVGKKEDQSGGLYELWFQIQGIKDCCCVDLSGMEEEPALEVFLIDKSLFM